MKECMFALYPASDGKYTVKITSPDQRNVLFGVDIDIGRIKAL